MKLRSLLAVGCGVVAVLAACDDENGERTEYDASVPVPAVEALDTTLVERTRNDTTWRPHADRDRRIRLRNHPPPDGRPDGRPDGAAPGSADSIPGTRVGVPDSTVRPASLPADPGDPIRADGDPSVLRLQVLLDRAGFSPGAIDGQWGKNTAKAVYWFQHHAGLEPTGLVDGESYRQLVMRLDDASTLREYRIRDEDLDGPFATVPAGIYAKARLNCLCYESPTELLAERFHATPGLLRRLNPDTDFDRLRPGQPIRVPNVDDPSDRSGADVARILISTGGFYTHALDDDGRIVFHFPSTVGSRYSPSPTGDFHVAAVVRLPRFHFTPDLYYDVPNTRRETVLPPGPNSPIGSIWLELSKPNYGIHGTAAPSTIGYVTSHGCVRLTNWDAHTLAHHVGEGTRVEFR